MRCADWNNNKRWNCWDEVKIIGEVLFAQCTCWETHYPCLDAHTPHVTKHALILIRDQMKVMKMNKKKKQIFIIWWIPCRCNLTNSLTSSQTLTMSLSLQCNQYKNTHTLISLTIYRHHHNTLYYPIFINFNSINTHHSLNGKNKNPKSLHLFNFTHHRLINIICTFSFSKLSYIKYEKNNIILSISNGIWFIIKYNLLIEFKGIWLRRHKGKVK